MNDTQARAHEELAAALDDIRRLGLDAAEAAATALTVDAAVPDSWPQVARTLQFAGQHLAANGARLADLLAACAAANPQVAVPTDGASQVMLPAALHRAVWTEAAAEVDDADHTAYAQVLDHLYGRPDLVARSRSLGGEAVLVLMHLVSDPSAVVAFYVGGVDAEDLDGCSALGQALREEGVVAGPPRFLKPAPPENSYLLHPEGTLTDVYGRIVPT